ncbi:MAG: TIGR02147 family protein [Chitinivibrionales bacterium]|nr:TIGR02147 family protein [Chitinivibrionales bacterium]
MNSIFNYLEYRDFLRDFYNSQKKVRYYFSYRYFGNRIGVDASFLSKVLHKELHISKRSVPKLFAFLKLSERETNYLKLLIAFGKAKKSDEIRSCFEQIINFDSGNVKLIQADQYGCFSPWYTGVVYLLLGITQNTGDMQSIADRIVPKVSIPDIERSLIILERLKLIYKDEKGVWRTCYKILKADSTIPTDVRTQYQKQMLSLGIEAVSNFHQHEQEIRLVTATLCEESVQRVKVLLQNLAKELLKIAEMEVSATRAYQINMQLFPLTTP